MILMEEDKVYINELEGGEVDILNAEKSPVKLVKTGMFLCKEGEVTLTIDDVEYHLHKNSIIVYFSYSTLHIISHTQNLRGTLIGGDLETIQPLLYQVTNFNALFYIKKEPLQIISEAQYDSLCKHIALLVQVTRKEQEIRKLSSPNNQSVAEIARKQTELLGNSLMLEILQCYTNVNLDNSPLTRKDEVLQKFVSQLYRTYRTQHEVGYYAEQQFLTSRYFSSIIKQKSGKSPSEWISTALLVDAKNLLKTTNMTIKEISDKLCFPNQSYFGKWFKNLMNVGPLDFRRGKKVTEINRSDFADIIQRGINHVNEY